ncbi:MAG: flippase-like domain-containing protein [Pyrinomonadaceae bacterium]|nr:flippase-like domain-containing protein [Pyrinomonadaceae bacterium]
MDYKSATDQELKPQISPKRKYNKIKTLVFVFTLFGVALFAYFAYTVGLSAIFEGIGKIGFGGFGIILFIYFLRLSVRATAWRFTAQAPYKLRYLDTLPAVIIGEALSSMIPLGILVSGTAKAVAVRKKVPLVVGLSTVATENLFFSFITGLFLCVGSFVFMRSFDLDPATIFTINVIIVSITVATIIGVLMVIRQWHWASAICEWLYRRGVLPSLLENGRKQVRVFEDLIYGFYRRYPKRFIPMCLLQAVFHLLGVFEVWFILSRIGGVLPQVSTAFFLETISRLITIVFKLIPFTVGVDEAGAEFIAELLGIGAGMGVTLAIIRKGRTIFWAGIGMLLLFKRGLTIREISEVRKTGAAKGELGSIAE